jgi:hypothetical protein
LNPLEQRKHDGRTLASIAAIQQLFEVAGADLR